MILKTIILFISAILGGLAIYAFDSNKINIKNLLIFAGSYLFSITVIHILPELFHTNTEGFHIGIMILAGFFIQYILEYFTFGVEHGHIHHQYKEKLHSRFSGYSLIIILCLHAFLEGTLLSYPKISGENHHVGSLLFGIILHKIPVALALMSILTYQFENNKIKFVLLFFFAISSPLGLISGNYIETIGFMNIKGIILLFAFVAGNFLHISTATFIEFGPEHNWNTKKLLISISGAIVAILTNILI